MASVLTELDQYDASVTVPDDGDTAGASSVAAAGVGFQPLANRTEFLRAKVPGALAATVVNVPVASGVAFTTGAVSNWAQFSWQTLVNTSGIIVSWTLPHLLGAELNSLIVYIDPAAGHGGTLPDTSPVLTLEAVNISTGVIDFTDSFEDATAIGTYETYHSFTLTPAAARAFNGFNLNVHIFNEFGGTAQSGLEVKALQMNVSPV